MNRRWTLPAGALALALTAAQAVPSQTASATTSTDLGGHASAGRLEERGAHAAEGLSRLR
jgi:hypothetical protein